MIVFKGAFCNRGNVVRMLRARLVWVSLLFLCGCANDQLPENLARALSYHPPRTRVSLDGTLQLQECDANGVLASPSLSLTATGVADPNVTFSVDGSVLNSWTQKHDLTLELNDDGTLNSINVVAEDRTGAIVANVIKTLTSIASLAARSGPFPACNSSTRLALQQSQRLADKIATLQSTLANSANNAKKVSEEIQALAERRAAIVAGKLTVTVSRAIDTEQAAGEIKWTLGDLAQWFAEDPDKTPCKLFSGAVRGFSTAAGDGCAAVATMFALRYTATGNRPSSFPKDSPCNTTSPSFQASRSQCVNKLAFVEPPVGTIALIATAESDFAGVSDGDTLTTLRAPMGQWGSISYLSLNAKFAESRTLAATFDQFGRKKKLQITSAARAENATSALADAVAGAGDFAKAIKPADKPSALEVLQGQNDLFEAKLKHNKYVSCQAILDAGGSECP